MQTGLLGARQPVRTMQPVLILTTTNSEEEAVSIAQTIIEERLAACVNISGPLTSLYRWEGKIEKETEYKLFIKTYIENWPSLREKIKKMHSYSVPDITLINTEQMNPEYLNWMDSVCEKMS